MTEKLCMFCTHLEYTSGGSYEYAEPSKLECEKGHYSKIRLDEKWMFGVDDFRRLIIKAKKCPDYDQVKV